MPIERSNTDRRSVQHGCDPSLRNVNDECGCKINKISLRRKEDAFKYELDVVRRLYLCGLFSGFFSNWSAWICDLLDWGESSSERRTLLLLIVVSICSADSFVSTLVVL